MIIGEDLKHQVLNIFDLRETEKKPIGEYG